MKAILAGALALALAWGGAWFAGRAAILRGLAQGLAASDTISAEDVALHGFPSRFDVTLSGVAAGRAAAAGGVRYDAPFVQIFAMIWKPWHLIAALPPEQVFTLGTDRAVTLRAKRLRASLLSAPRRDLPLREARIEGAALTLVGLGLAQNGASLAEGFAALTWLADSRYRAGLRLRDVQLAGLPLAQGFADAEISLAAPIVLNGGAAPAVQNITLTEARLSWEGAEVRAKGRLAPDSAGKVAGEIAVTVTGTKAVLAAVTVAGMIAPDLAARLGQAAVNDAAQIDLHLRAGQVWWGFVPLGAAPDWPL